MTKIPGAGVTLAAHEWAGRGPAAVAIHGLTANHRCWASVADALAPAVRLIGYDLRGRGESDKPPTGYSLGIHGDDLAALLDHFGLRRVILIGHSLGASIALRFAVTHPRAVARLVLIDGGLDVRAEVLDSLAPAVGRVGVEFPSFPAFLDRIKSLPMFAGRWNEHLERYFDYDVERLPSGAVRSKAARHAIEEEVRNLMRERMWVDHHRVRCPTLLVRAPDGLLTATDCLMTPEEGRAMARAIPRCTLAVIPHTNHYTVLLGRNPKLRTTLRRFLGVR